MLDQIRIWELGGQVDNQLLPVSGFNFMADWCVSSRRSNEALRLVCHHFAFIFRYVAAKCYFVKPDKT